MGTHWFRSLFFGSSLLFVLGSHLALGQLSQPDETLPGFRAQDVLFSGTYDNVNAYNGDTGVVIPLGPSYPLGKDFTFQVRAYNTLKFWSFIDGDTCDLWDGSGPKDVTKAFIAGFPTIGAAWTLSPGYVTDDTSGSGFTYIYVSPDGGHHPAGADGITLDGTRLKITCTPWTTCTVAFPNGTTQIFNQTLSDPAPLAGSSPDFSLGEVSHALGLYQVKDAWGRVMLTVEYGTNNAPSWGAGRIYLGTTSAPAIALNWYLNGLAVAGGVTWPAVNSITFPAINGSPTETVTFGYDTSHTIERSPADTTLQTATCPCTASESDPAVAYVHELTSVSLANGSTQVASFQMAYGDSSHSGGLTSLTLPTGGQITYTLGVAQHASGDSNWPDTSLETSDRGGLAPGAPPPLAPGCPPTHAFITDTLGNSTAVIERQLTVGGLTSTTTYARLDNVPTSYPGTNHGQGYNTRIVEVTEPVDGANSKLTRFLFHIPDAGQTDPSVSGVEIEHSVYLGTSFSGSGAIRTTINCEDRKSTAGFCGYLTSDGTSVNAFPTNSGNYVHDSGHVTWYGDKPSGMTDASGGTCPDSASLPCVSQLSTGIGNWVSNGYHYELTETSSGNFGTRNIDRTTDTLWATSGWLLDLYTRRTTYDGASEPAYPQSDGATVVREWHENDTSNGFVKGAMVWDSPSHTYLLNCGYRDSAGAIAHLLSFTDSEFSSPPTTPCTSNFATWPPTINVTALGMNSDYFGHDYTSQNGQLTKAQWVTGATGTVADLKWNAFNATRDASTGLITTSQGTDATQTAYTYDGLGRLRVIDPPDTSEAATYVCYDSPTQTTVYRATSQLTCPVTPGASTLAWHQYQYDGLGRLIREYRLQPDLTQAKRFTLYDAGGNAYFHSEWVSSGTSETITPNTSKTVNGCTQSVPSAAPGTFLFCFDAFGRPQGSVGPKFTSYATTVRTDGLANFSDTQETTTVSCVNGTWSGTTCSGGSSATTTTLKDPFGRVTQVTEPSSDVTSYSYNVLDKLTSVTQGTQTRSSTYNAFGFLTGETSPEQGTVSYTYGSLGNVREKNEGGGTNYIDTTYEAAARTAQTCAGGTSDLTCTSNSPYVSNSYDAGCTTGSQSGCGKLTQSTGYNYPLDSGPPVTQTLSYSAADGRLTGRTTAIGTDSDTNDGIGVRDGESIQTTESWAYNNLGLVQTYNVPRLSGSYALGYTYGTDLPTAISAGGTTRASSALYNPGDALTQWVSAGGGSAGGSVTTTIGFDASIPSRPTSIATSGASSNFSSGTYTYDGAGNIMAIGSDNFKYDTRSRLVSAFYSGQAATCTDSLGNTSRGQCFAYDRYANLTGITGDGSRSLATSTSTNHLTGKTYDARGNMVSGGGFDGLDRLFESNNGWVYLFDAAGERVAKFPDNLVLRREMAKLTVQARGEAKSTSGCYPSNPAVDLYYDDVACTDPDRGWIDKANEDGISQGYGNRQYGPGDSVTREQMAKFIVLALNQQAATGCDPNHLTFSDVPCTDPLWGYVQQIYIDGITNGCGDGTMFCPTQSVPESQMMAFTSRGWGNYLYVPRGTIYTLRDVQGRVETELASTPGSTSYPTNDFPVASQVTRDNVFLGNLLVASNAAANGLGGTPGWTYYFSDHLGTPRLISGAEGPQLEKYWPYGDEVTTDTTSQKLRFATMERDTENNHFYDHARSHDFNLGRFVSVDKVGGRTRDPQSWNRYTYSRSNPVKLVDPNGLFFILANESDRARFANAFATASGDSRARAALTALAHDPRPILLQKGPLPTDISTVVGKDGKRHTQTSFTFGLTEAQTPLTPNGGDRTASGAVVTVDFDKLSSSAGATNGQVDPAGAVTTTHELAHVYDDFYEGVGASQQQDVTGSAQDFGESSVFFPDSPSNSFSIQQANELINAAPDPCAQQVCIDLTPPKL